MKKLLIGMGLLAIVGCAHHYPAGISANDKKVWTCAGLARVDKTEPLAEARDRVEIYQVANSFKLIGFGTFEKINTTEEQGSFRSIASVDQDPEFKTGEDLYKNSLGDSVHINKQNNPNEAVLHVHGVDYNMQCLDH